MRVAFFSPLPPAKSGIADYSSALLEHLKGLVEVESFAAKPASFDAARSPDDICVRQRRAGFDEIDCDGRIGGEPQRRSIGPAAGETKNAFGLPSGISPNGLAPSRRYGGPHRRPLL